MRLSASPPSPTFCSLFSLSLATPVDRADDAELLNRRHGPPGSQTAEERSVDQWGMTGDHYYSYGPNGCAGGQMFSPNCPGN
ncbi:MAG: hypothetical protein M1832_005964 [Thelocarpon impressellum]|nr:MAG: hypothetical protein M1832_005964 [Thelocarpon impressellum]